MKLNSLLTVCVASLVLTSCVSSKKFKKSQADYAQLQTRYTTLEGTLADCNNVTAGLEKTKWI